MTVISLTPIRTVPLSLRASPRHTLQKASCGGVSRIKVIPQQAEVAQGVPGRLRPRIFLTFRHYKGGRSSALRAGRLYPRRNPWYSFPEAESTPGHMVPSGTTEKIPSDTTGNRSRDLPTSSAVRSKHVES